MKKNFYRFLSFISPTPKLLLLHGILFSCFCFAQQKNGSASLNPKADSIQKVLITAKSDTTLAAAYVALTEELYLSNIDTVLPLCNKAIQIIDSKLAKSNDAEKKSFLTTKANALNNMGFVYKEQGNITKALEWYHESLKIREDIGDKRGIANSLSNIGRIYHNRGDIPKALDCYNKSLKTQNEIGDKQGIAVSLTNIGFIYFNQGDIQKALEWYHKSLKISEEIGDKEGVAISLGNIGQVS